MFSSDNVEEPMAQPAPDQEPTTTSQLEEIAALKAKGLITPEEFEAKKKQILGI